MLKRVTLAALASLALLVGVGFTTANADGPAYYDGSGPKVWNFGDVGTGISRYVDNSWDIIVYPRSWSPGYGWAQEYTGPCWHTDIYYAYSDPGMWANQATWHYVWTNNGGYAWLNNQIRWVGLYSYRVC